MKLVLDQMKGTRLALYSKKCYSFQLSVNIISLKGVAIKKRPYKCEFGRHRSSRRVLAVFLAWQTSARVLPKL